MSDQCCLRGSEEASMAWPSSGEALVTETGSVGYRELRDLVSRAAVELERAGAGPGDPVVLCLPNGVGWVVAYLAIRRIGAVSVPLNPASAVDEVGWVLADSGARLALVPAAMLPDLAERFEGRLVCWPDGRSTGERIAGKRENLDGVATIAYTSGTTGRPKGALQSPAAVEAGGRIPAERLGLGTHEVLATALPLAHSFGMNMLNAVLEAGATLTLLRRFDEAGIFGLVNEWGAGVLAGVPTMYRRLLAHPGAAVLANLRCALSAGQSAGRDLALDWECRTGGAFVEGWGMTELAGFASLATPGLDGRHGTAGTAVPGIDLRVAAGELLVSGPVVTAGYLGDEEKTARAIGPDGWLRTGDVGSIDAAGLVRIAGRIKDVIVTGGYNVYPAEVERAVSAHPAVRDVAVAGLPDDLRGEIVCAWVVPHADSPVTDEQLADHCRRYLASYKLPRRTVFVDGLPLTPTGKIARSLLPGLAS
jgi:long-chain acyl-CoA synthetase